MEPQHNYVVMNPKQQKLLEDNKGNFESFKNSTPFPPQNPSLNENPSRLTRDDDPKSSEEIASLKKYIKLINWKIKGLAETVNELRKENGEMKQKVEVLTQ